MVMFWMGFVAGAGLIVSGLLLYLWQIKKSSERESKKVFRDLAEQNEIDEEIKDLVLNAKKKILKFDNFGVEKNLKNLKSVSIELAMEISKKYNPDVKYPHLELTFYELLKLAQEIIQFFLENLEKKYFVHLKKAKVAHILELNDIKEQHLSKVEKSGKIITTANFFKDPVKTIIKKATTTALLPIAVEAFLKIGGNYGIEKLGKELNLIYSGHYNKNFTENFGNEESCEESEVEELVSIN